MILPMPIYQITSAADIKLIERINTTLPWWLFDRIPQGFAGRVYAKKIAIIHPELPSNLTDWSDEVVLRVLERHPIDAIGNLLLGETDLIRYQSAKNNLISISELPVLAKRSEEVCSTLISGEQPKFCCNLNNYGPCIVKYAQTPRAIDLLIAEHTALSVLNDAGIASATSMLIRNNDYQFLVIHRFDCIGETGRRGLVSLKALDLEFAGSRDQRWPFIADKLAKNGVIDTEQLQIIKLLFCFGRLIANTDMHSGNLSFFNDDVNIRPYVLAPAYDMLPMAFLSEGTSELTSLIVDSDLPNETWMESYKLAVHYWQILITQPDLSYSFQHIAEKMNEYLQNIVYPKISE